MASKGLLPASLLIPPSDPQARRDWAEVVEQQIAESVRTNLRRILTEAFDAYLGTLTAAGDVTALESIPAQWMQYVSAELLPTYVGMYMGAGISAWTSAPGVASLSVETVEGWTKVVNEQAVIYQQTATNRLVGVGDDLWQTVNSKVVRAVETGATNEELKNMIEEVSQFSEYRADTIARTETAAAYSGGNWDAANALGDYGPVAKVWNTSLDGRTRPDHIEANDQTVAWSEPFIVGGDEMMRPHDPAAPGKQTINCRCRLLELYEGDVDPLGRTWSRTGPSAPGEPPPKLERMGRGWTGQSSEPTLIVGDDGWQISVVVD